MLNNHIPPQDEFRQSQVERKILEAIQGIRYGAVEIVIHDGRVVQIERKEKWRLDLETAPRASRKS